MNEFTTASWLHRLARHGAVGAMAAQVTQAGSSFALQLIAAIALGLAGFGKFALLYGGIVMLTGIASGFVGDSMTVLDRRSVYIRSALQGWALILSVLAGVAGGTMVVLTGFVTLSEGMLFGSAVVVFLLEDVLRRLLMAELRFWRIAVVDLSALLIAMSVLAIAFLSATVSLAMLFGALALGQGVALAVAATLMPRDERYLVRFALGGYRRVFRYGIWRSFQQGVRPALFTGVRTVVVVAVGLTAVGQLETARLFVAPAMLLVSGFSTFLFASFAKDRHVALSVLLKKADLGVLYLVGLTIGIGVVSLFILPTVGRLLAGERLNIVMVLGWITFSASVAAVTPYGALAAVRGKQATVLAFRVTDSALSFGGAAVVIAIGGPVSLIPFVLTVGSLLGGLSIRWLILRPNAALQQKNSAPEAIPIPKKKAASHV
jgi:O-antigen/teichoic acid export membrane protein